jgi:branched-chain amino acid transport system substrate-binding protein
LKLKTPKVGILGEKTVAVDPLVKAAQDSLPKMGLELVGTWRPEPTATDLTPELGAIKRSGAQLVLVFVSGPLGTVLGRQWNEQQVAALPFGINGEAQSEAYWEATAKKGNFMTIFAPYGDADLSPETQPFLKAYRARFQVTPGCGAATYDAVLLLRETIEQKSTLDSDALAEALEQIDQPATFGRLVFDKRHDPTWGAGYITGLAVQWQGGALVPIWPNGWHDVKYEGIRPLQLPPGTK